MTATLAPEAPAIVRRRFPSGKRPLVVGAISILLAIAGLTWILVPRSAEETDNAYLKADNTAVAPKVGGLVAAVLVRDNQPVHIGDPLVQIDAQEFDARLAAAEAALADAKAGVATARASLAGLGADDALAAARVRATQSSIQSADAEYIRATADRARFEALAARGFVTRRDTERVRATAIAAQSLASRSRADQDVAREQSTVTRARAPVLSAELAKAQAVEARALAALDLAKQDRGHTVIRAAINGVVGNRQVQVGDFVQPGSRMMMLVPAQGLYVVANFKETQTRRMLVGQPVKIRVDALGGDAITGHVESFAPASGSEFTLLPFEPGSGNFTKIVQRVPVRIRLDPDQPVLGRLRPGLSVTAKVQLK